jgi:hypothetical protein
MSSWKRRSNPVLILVAVLLVGCSSRRPYGVNSNPRVLQQLLKLAESGDVEAQQCLGHYYNTCDAENPALAAYWYRRAALHGDAMSSYMLSGMASGTNQTLEGYSSVFWLMLAAKQGYKTAKGDIFFRYNSGNGMPTNSQMSVAWGQGIFDVEWQLRIGEKLLKKVSGFSKEENAKVNMLCALIGEATKQKLWKKELEQGMGDTNLMDFAWTYEYLSKPGVLLSGTSLKPESNKTFFDELSADKISYVLIGDRQEHVNFLKEHFWGEEIPMNYFNSMQCVTNRQTIVKLIAELKNSKVAATYGIIDSSKPTELYVSKTGKVLAQVYSINGYPCVTVRKGSVIKKKDNYFSNTIKFEYGDFIVCRSETYGKILSEVLKDIDK